MKADFKQTIRQNKILGYQSKSEIFNRISWGNFVILFIRDPDRMFWSIMELEELELEIE